MVLRRNHGSSISTARLACSASSGSPKCTAQPTAWPIRWRGSPDRACWHQRALDRRVQALDKGGFPKEKVSALKDILDDLGADRGLLMSGSRQIDQFRSHRGKLAVLAISTRTAVRVHVEIAVRDRLAAVVIGRPQACPPGGCGRQAELL